MHLDVEETGVVRFVLDRVVKFVSRHFALKCEKMECLKDVKSECASWAFDRRRHQAGSKQLNTVMGAVATFAKGHREGVNAICIDDGKILNRSAWTRTSTEFVAQTQLEAKGP